MAMGFFTSALSAARGLWADASGSVSAAGSDPEQTATYLVGADTVRYDRFGRVVPALVAPAAAPPSEPEQIATPAPTPAPDPAPPAPAPAQQRRRPGWLRRS